MSFAIIETGGKQYKVSASNILKVEKLNIVKGKKVEFKKVLLVNDDKNTEVGNPTVQGALVEGLVLDKWHVNTFTSAEYTISVDYDTNNKEMLKVLVVASPNQSSLTIYGRSNLGNNFTFLLKSRKSAKKSSIKFHVLFT